MVDILQFPIDRVYVGVDYTMIDYSRNYQNNDGNATYFTLKLPVWGSRLRIAINLNFPLFYFVHIADLFRTYQSHHKSRVLFSRRKPHAKLLNLISRFLRL